MKENFEPCFAHVLKSEGGFVNDPHDPGGMTNLGVTKKTWEGYVGHAVSENDMRSLTVDTVSGLYESRYWDIVKCNELQSGLDYVVFDTAVNNGVSRAARYLQGAAGVPEDGVIGPLTLKTVLECNTADLINKICDRRIALYQRQPEFPHDGKGWLSRVESVRKTALEMAST